MEHLDDESHILSNRLPYLGETWADRDTLSMLAVLSLGIFIKMVNK